MVIFSARTKNWANPSTFADSNSANYKTVRIIAKKKGGQSMYITMLRTLITVFISNKNKVTASFVNKIKIKYRKNRDKVNVVMEVKKNLTVAQI